MHRQGGPVSFRHRPHRGGLRERGMQAAFSCEQSPRPRTVVYQDRWGKACLKFVASGPPPPPAFRPRPRPPSVLYKSQACLSTSVYASCVHMLCFSRQPACSTQTKPVFATTRVLAARSATRSQKGIRESHVKRQETTVRTAEICSDRTHSYREDQPTLTAPLRWRRRRDQQPRCTPGTNRSAFTPGFRRASHPPRRPVEVQSCFLRRDQGGIRAQTPRQKLARGFLGYRRKGLVAERT